MEAPFDQNWRPGQRLLTIPQAAHTLRTSRSTIYRLMDRGELRWVEVGCTRRVSSDEIDRYITQHTRAAS
ncbi:helix-turn-helix domain-containing protein [Mycobacterium sp.]|uniref:helix-turn-helix domain-containing protein n=1 Tax=Mycobacterium sp. TaxID=1785 RepID=UPI003CC627D8